MYQSHWMCNAQYTLPMPTQHNTTAELRRHQRCVLDLKVNNFDNPDNINRFLQLDFICLFVFCLHFLHYPCLFVRVGVSALHTPALWFIAYPQTAE